MSYNTQLLSDLRERIQENSGSTQSALVRAYGDANDSEHRAMEIIWQSNDEETTDGMWQDIFEIVDVDFERTVKNDLKRKDALDRALNG